MSLKPWDKPNQTFLYSFCRYSDNNMLNWTNYKFDLELPIKWKVKDSDTLNEKTNCFQKLFLIGWYSSLTRHRMFCKSANNGRHMEEEEHTNLCTQRYKINRAIKHQSACVLISPWSYSSLQREEFGDSVLSAQSIFRLHLPYSQQNNILLLYVFYSILLCFAVMVLFAHE